MDPYNFAGFNQSPSYTGRIKAVHGMEGAKNIQLAPNSSVILPDDSEKIMWVIEANNFGVKSVAGYEYGKQVADSDSQNNPTSFDETPVYVTTKEFDELKAKLDKLLAELGGEKQ